MGFAIDKVRDYADIISSASANPAPATAVVGITLPGLAKTASIQIEQFGGAFTATFEFEVSIDGGQNWNPLAMTPSSGGAAVTSASAVGLWVADVSGYVMIQARCSALTAGTPKVTIHAG